MRLTKLFHLGKSRRRRLHNSGSACHFCRSSKAFRLSAATAATINIISVLGNPVNGSASRPPGRKLPWYEHLASEVRDRQKAAPDTSLLLRISAIYVSYVIPTQNSLPEEMEEGSVLQSGLKHNSSFYMVRSTMPEFPNNVIRTALWTWQSTEPASPISLASVGLALSLNPQTPEIFQFQTTILRHGSPK